MPPPPPPPRSSLEEAQDLAYPKYIAASLPPPPNARVALLLELAVPSATHSALPPISPDPHAFHAALRTAQSAPAPPPHGHIVLLRHSALAATTAGGVVVRNTTPAARARARLSDLHDDFVESDNDLCLCLIPPDAPHVRHAELHMAGPATPLFLASLVHRAQLRLYWHPARELLQFVFVIPPLNQPPPAPRRAALARVLRWLANLRGPAAGATVGSLRPAVYDKDWVFGCVRRRLDDPDAGEYRPFLHRVRENAGLNVRLRPYQQRAVAWMLSRELRPPLHLFRDIVWRDAERLADVCCLHHFANITVLTRVAVNVLEGDIKALDDHHDDPAAPDPALVDEHPPRGGLLCDEMGLGKTVELMQLVLCNKMPQSSSSVDESKQQPAPGSDPVTTTETCQECHQSVSGRRPASLPCLECGSKIHKACLGGLQVSARRYGYVCPDCCNRMQRLSAEDTLPSELPQSKATVVVIPTTLLLQWQDEIQKHCKDALNIVVFLGLRRSGYISHKTLMQADVVLTTYDALKADIATFTALRKPRSGLRRPPRFRPTPIPLLTMRWHRLALDESQMLGSAGVSQAAQMASYMHAKYIWGVTGTPISYSAENIIPMLDMLRVQGAQHRMNWGPFFASQCFEEDEKRVKFALRQLMWRTSKEDVYGVELELPAQIVEEIRTRFGPVEKYHYNSLQQSVQEATVGFNLSSNRRQISLSVDLLTMLRQACCHPQIGISGRRLMSRAARQALRQTMPRTTNANALQKASSRAENPLSMNEVLDALITKAKVECAEALRSFVSSSNGLAAVCWLQHSILPPRSAQVDGLISAVRLYRQTLNICEENKAVVRLDNIQKMHILFNLNEALSLVASSRARIAALPCPSAVKEASLCELSSIGKTIRDGNLAAEVRDLSRVYLAEAESDLVSAKSSYESFVQDLREEPLVSVATESDSPDDEEGGSNFFGGPTQTRTRGPRPWWQIAVAVLIEEDGAKQESFLNRLVQRLLDQVPGGQVDMGSVANKLTSVLAIPSVIEKELALVQKSRTKLRDQIAVLPGASRPSQAEVAESGQCRECREFGRGPACKHCRSEVFFMEMDRHLYSVNMAHDPEDLILHTDDTVQCAPNATEAPIQPQAVVNDVFKPKGTTFRAPTQISGLRYQSQVETILKALAAPLRAKKDPLINKQIADWFSRLEAVKKEHLEARRLFEAQRSLLARMDEVNMAVMRLSVLDKEDDYGSLSEEERRHRLPRDSLPSLNIQFSSEKSVAEADFRSKRGSLVYLLSLQRAATAENGNSDEGTRGQNSAIKCPVCMGEFDDSTTRVALFVCGHVLCCDCTLSLIRRSDARARITNVSCPTCRIRCPVDEINFTTSRPSVAQSNETTAEDDESSQELSTTPETVTDEEDEISPTAGMKRKASDPTDATSSVRKARKISERTSTFYDRHATVNGLIGAKASAVVRTLRGIWRQDASAKVLVFSEWLEVLGLLSSALNMNDITHMDTSDRTSAIQFANVVDRFKTTDTHNVLLLPLKRAGAGLNLIEARHVVLMEPSMNVSLEAQGVGRVHRIGQDKTTYVHRIIVNHTIEDKILSLGDAYRGKNTKNGEATIEVTDVMGFIHSTSPRARVNRNTNAPANVVRLNPGVNL